MRNSLKKIALACAATLALSVMSVSAADLAKDTDYTYDATAGTVSVVTDSSAISNLTSGQYTVLIYEKTETTDETNILDSEIVYINQAAKEALGDEFVGMGLKNGLEDGKTYVMKIGGTNVAASGILKAEFTVGDDGSVIMLGDANLDNSVDTTDAAYIIQNFLGSRTLEGDALAAADASQDGEVDTTDAAYVIQDFLGSRTLNPEA